MRSRNVGYHPSGHYRHYSDIKRCQLYPQSVAVAVQGGFTGVVDRAEDVRYLTSQTPDLYDGAFRFDQERCKCLAHLHDREEIRLECFSDLIHVYIEGWNGVVASGIVY